MRRYQIQSDHGQATPGAEVDVHAALEMLIAYSSPGQRAAMLQAVFSVFEPEGRFAPSHMKTPLFKATRALAAYHNMPLEEVRDKLAERWSAHHNHSVRQGHVEAALRAGALRLDKTMNSRTNVGKTPEYVLAQELDKVL